MRFYHRFVNETLDSNGTLKTFEPKLPDNYNFGYDVVDAIASETPDKLAMVWCNAFGDDKQFTFSDISRLSTKTANVFSKYGIKKGDKVIVETTQGEEIGEVVIPNRHVDDEKIIGPLKKVLRIATYKDYKRYDECKKIEKEAFKICEKKIKEHKLKMSLTDVECKFDNSKILFYFIADGRIDFRDLVKDLAAIYRTRI